MERHKNRTLKTLKGKVSFFFQIYNLNKKPFEYDTLSFPINKRYSLSVYVLTYFAHTECWRRYYNRITLKIVLAAYVLKLPINYCNRPDAHNTDRKVSTWTNVIAKLFPSCNIYFTILYSHREWINSTSNRLNSLAWIIGKQYLSKLLVWF